MIALFRKIGVAAGLRGVGIGISGTGHSGRFQFCGRHLLQRLHCCRCSSGKFQLDNLLLVTTSSFFSGHSFSIPIHRDGFDGKVLRHSRLDALRSVLFWVPSRCSNSILVRRRHRRTTFPAAFSADNHRSVAALLLRHQAHLLTRLAEVQCLHSSCSRSSSLTGRRNLLLVDHRGGADAAAFRCEARLNGGVDGGARTRGRVFTRTCCP